MILNSWKEIASYLRCSVRTAQRLENAGMPVRRPAGHSRSAVVALTDEIEMWLKSSKTGQGAVTGVVFETERGIHIRAEMAALKQRLAECRQRSNQLRVRALEIRMRKPFAAPLAHD